MSLKHKEDFSMRERMALRVLVIMYRIIGPHEHSFRTENDLKFILNGEED